MFGLDKAARGTRSWNINPTTSRTNKQDKKSRMPPSPLINTAHRYHPSLTIIVILHLNHLSHIHPRYYFFKRSSSKKT
ncbi:hypothetical protein VTJ04DRAFT_2340 [Mycothermus thermophilus]|uniref:uncharacterized protein n=1 Tax=Humicola insolens TaxID=85995 RepID=UPI003742719D